MSNSQLYFDLLADRDLTALRRVIEVEPSAADARDANGVSLVMQAIYRGQGDLAAFIAEKKVTLDIFEAAALGRLDRLRELVLDPAIVNCRSADGFTALHFACFFGQPESAFILIESGATVDAVAANPTKVMPLHSAASVRNLEAARLLLVHGAPPNARQQGGWAPIHAAAQNGDRPMVELLLQHGADPKQANDAGKTAAMVAREKGHHEIAGWLEK
jgi:ankyrin repeat protein